MVVVDFVAETEAGVSESADGAEKVLGNQTSRHGGALALYQKVSKLTTICVEVNLAVDPWIYCR